MNEEKNMTKEEGGGGKVILFAITVATIVYIIYNEFYKRKLEEKNKDLEKNAETKESQIKMQEMIIKEKTNQLISIISKIRPAENPSSWQSTKESSEEIWEGSKLIKKIFRKTKEVLERKRLKPISQGQR